MPVPVRSTRRKRISDAKLVALARERDELMARAAKLQSAADKRAQVIIEELESRGTTRITHDGYGITKVTNESVVYDWDYLKSMLPTSEWNRITKRLPDASALSREVQEGRIELEVVQAASQVRSSKPYIRVSQK